MKNMTIVGLAKLLGSMGINFSDILDEVCNLTNEKYDYIKKIKSKKRKRKGIK